MSTFNLYIGIDGKYTRVPTKGETLTELVVNNGNLGDVNDRRANFSRSINIFRTQEVDALFGYAYEVSTLTQNKTISAYIESEGVEIMKGGARLLSADEFFFNIAIYSEVLPEFENIGIKLNELNFYDLQTFGLTIDDIKIRLLMMSSEGFNDKKFVLPMSTIVEDATFIHSNIGTDLKNITGGVNFLKAVEICLKNIYPNKKINIASRPEVDFLYFALPLKTSLTSEQLRTYNFEKYFSFNTLNQSFKWVDASNNSAFTYVNSKGVSINGNLFSEVRTIPAFQEFQNKYVDEAVVYRFEGVTGYYDLNTISTGLKITTPPTEGANINIYYYSDLYLRNTTKNTLKLLSDIKYNSFFLGFYPTPTSAVFNVGVNSNSYSKSVLLYNGDEYIFEQKTTIQTAGNSFNGTYSRPFESLIIENNTKIDINNVSAEKPFGIDYPLNAFFPNKTALSLVKDFLKITNSRLIVENDSVSIYYDIDKYKEGGKILTNWRGIKGTRKLKFDKSVFKSFEFKPQKTSDPTTKNNYIDALGYYKIDFDEKQGVEMVVSLDNCAVGTFTNYNYLYDVNTQYAGLDMRGQSDQYLRLFYLTPQGSKGLSPSIFNGVRAPYTAPVYFLGDKFYNICFDPNQLKDTFLTPRLDAPNIQGNAGTYQKNSISLFYVFYANLLDSINSKNFKVIEENFYLTPEEFSLYSYRDKIVIDGALFEIQSINYNIETNIAKVQAFILPPSYITAPAVNEIIKQRPTNTGINEVNANINNINDFLPNRYATPFIVIDNNFANYRLNEKVLINGNK